MSVRLNKLLAQRGIGARRKCDALIESGVVKVNGVVVREPGSQVNPEIDRIDVAGRRLPPQPELRYYALNKPVGVITTLNDPEGRRTLREFLPPGSRVYPVGRLDADTSGLLILTNDGELAHKLMHPRYGVEKHYRVRVDREPNPAEVGKLAKGVEFEPGVVSAPAQVRVLETTDRGTMISLTIHEGRYRQVRRMCEAVGLTVLTLHRAGYGPVRLGPLPRGVWRELSDDEVASLRSASARPQARSGGPRLTQFDRIQRRATSDRAAERRTERARTDQLRDEHRARNSRKTPRDAELMGEGPAGEEGSRPARSAGFDAPRGGVRKRPAARGPRPDASRGEERPRPSRGEGRPRPESRSGGFGAPRGEGRPRPESRGGGFGAPRGAGRPRPDSRGEGRPRPGAGGPRPTAPRSGFAGSRPGTGSARPRSTGPRTGFAGSRPSTGGPRPRPGAGGPRPTGPRTGFAGSRPSTGGPRPRPGAGGPRPTGPRTGFAGSRPSTGGPRPRPGAGGPRPTGPRTGFAGSRPSTGGPRPRPGAGGPRPTGPRTGFAGSRPSTGGPRPRPGAGGPRPTGSRTGFAGSRPGSSGPRPGTSGPRRPAGPPRSGPSSSRPGGAPPRGKPPRGGRSGPPGRPGGRPRG